MLREVFQKFMEEYSEVYDEVYRTSNWKHSFGSFVRNDICKEILSTIDLTGHTIKGSCGQARWTPVPWIAIFDPRITDKASKGVYIVYLLNKDSKKLYLTLNQAATEAFEIESGSGQFSNTVKAKNKKVLEELRKKVLIIREAISVPEEYTISIDCGSPAYDAGCICAIEYSLQNLPEEDSLKKDLSVFLNIYDRFYRDYWTKKQGIDLAISPEPDEVAFAEPDDERTIIGRITKFLSKKGYSYELNSIANFYICLKSKPFVILAGTSGTGKTKLVRLFAEAIGAEYKLVPVRPDWSDSTDLFGHTNLKNEFVSCEVTDYVRKAIDNPLKPFFLCLDEMNLARVEYYLSDFLSVVETRELENDRIVTMPLALGNEARERFGEIYIPDNLYIVGTVNMDETTFPFSKKVLDRANTIEFSEVNLIPDFSPTENEKTIVLSNDFLKTKYLVLKTDVKDEQKDFVTGICEELQKINKVLEKANAHVGYRVRDEIVFYMLNNREADLLKRDEAFDFEIMQKILPRIQGSTTAVKDLLIDLFKEFGGDFTTGSSDLIWKQMQSYIGSDKPKKYPKSGQKICYMMRKFEEDGFTSYWI